MPARLSPVIAATAQWLTRSFPAPGGALSTALCEIQARQAVTVAARLRHPTPVDAELVGLAGPGGTTRLDGVTGAEGLGSEPWRSWVDEVVASWAACLLSDAGLAARAVPALPSGSRVPPPPLPGPDGQQGGGLAPPTGHGVLGGPPPRAVAAGAPGTRIHTVGHGSTPAA
ncbi:hypothetical protein GCM10022285_51220 [Streptomyces tunisiensis]|uniref:Uncharacterized protein n=1 Tax=Streptomyces tunisiensis TaxID=948699 RepID=A0ABP7Z286_9ACTN